MKISPLSFLPSCPGNKYSIFLFFVNEMLFEAALMACGNIYYKDIIAQSNNLEVSSQTNNPGEVLVFRIFILMYSNVQRIKLCRVK